MAGRSRRLVAYTHSSLPHICRKSHLGMCHRRSTWSGRPCLLVRTSPQGRPSRAAARNRAAVPDLAARSCLEGQDQQAMADCSCSRRKRT